MTDMHALVPKGIYRGEPWSEVPVNYLFYMGNKHWFGDLAIMCRAEVVRRYAQRGAPDPWAGTKQETKV